MNQGYRGFLSCVAAAKHWGWLVCVSLLCLAPEATALPAFALREKAPCELCHVNGSAPHLTRYGFMYRRAGYRNPADIGNVEKDTAAMVLTDHMAVGVNFDYEYVTNKAPDTSSTQTPANQFDVREVELWPLVGAFMGNIGVFSEIDASPNLASPGPNATSSGGVQLTHAELVYVKGNADLAFSFRGGVIASQGYGASDQWLDDGNIPLMDQLTSQRNQDTLVTPLGANQAPQVGSEIGLAYQSETYLTLGAYNGFDGTGALGTKNPQAIDPVLHNGNAGGVKDFKVQVDQFLGGSTEITAAYYHGAISLLDDTNTEVWRNHFQLGRLYLTQTLTGSVDLLAGIGDGKFQYADGVAANSDGSPSASLTPTGTFTSPGGFVGFNYYVEPHLTVSGRYDHFEYSREGGLSKTNGGALMVGIPVDNTFVNVHYNLQASDVTGLTNDVRVEWRLLF